MLGASIGTVNTCVPDCEPVTPVLYALPPFETLISNGCVEPPPFNTQSIYVSPNYSDSFGGSLSTDLFGAGSFTPSQDLGDPQLSPEIKKEYEIGTDLRFFDNKIKLMHLKLLTMLPRWRSLSQYI